MGVDNEEPGNESQPSDVEIIAEVIKGNRELFDLLVRRYNTRLYRIARSIVGESAEAEDVAQEAWVLAYLNLHGYAGAASFSTWVSKIAVHEALKRLRRRARSESLESVQGRRRAQSWPAQDRTSDPEKLTFGKEVRRKIENALDALPSNYRSVFVLRCVEQLDVAETAAVLGITEDAVKARLHRARGILQRAVGSALGQVPPDLYRFPAPRCDRLVEIVSRRLSHLHT